MPDLPNHLLDGERSPGAEETEPSTPADGASLRQKLSDTEPRLSEWEWSVLSFVIDNDGAALVGHGNAEEALIDGDATAITLMQFANDTLDDEVPRITALARRVLTWSPP